MPDDLYERDILTWSEHQADLLRRAARGERVNGVDWEHVIEEIEDVGLGHLHDVQIYLRRMLVALLKVHGWPDSASVVHWRDEIGNFQAEADQRYVPSMRQRIDLACLYDRAKRQLADMTYDGRQPVPWPDANPFTLDQLLAERRPALEGVLTAHPNA